VEQVVRVEIPRMIERLKTSQKARLKDVVEPRREVVNPRQLDPSMPYVGLEHIMPGEFLLRRFGKAGSVKSSKLRFYKGDILYGRLRPYLDKVVVATVNGVCSTDIIVLKAKEGVMPEFLVLVLHSTRFINYARQRMRGTDRPRVNWSSLADFTITLPPLDEQKTVIDVLFMFERLRELYNKQLEKLDRIKRGLTDLLLSS